ncbi:MAG: transposase, partial [Deferribacteraceae bacterium]|nr:transposase [Deferribacteraceae bacterium]
MEESYKFIKQSFGLERAAIKKFAGIKCLLGI